MRSLAFAAALAACLATSMFQNPVLGKDAPDPGVLYDASSSAWYAVTTSAECEGGATDTFPIWKSSDLASWDLVGYIFPGGSWPGWMVQDCWAPELHIVNGVYTAYFVGRNADGILSIGVALSKGGILGPYVDPLGRELLTTASQPGMIDPHFFRDDDGQNYLVWKKDGNSVGQTTPIYISRLSSNGTKMLDATWPTLIHNDLSWEGSLVEAPWIVKRQGIYYLFYSGNIFGAYAVGVAQSSSVTGPYVKRGAPILQTSTTAPAFIGPGHCSVVQAQDGNYGLLYHAWPYAPAVNFSMPRYLMLENVLWSSGSNAWPSIIGSCPSTTSQPVP